MELLLLVNLNIIWIMLLVNLILILRIIRWVRATNEAQIPKREHAKRPELVIGSPAPDFKARTLTNQPVGLDDYAGRAVAFIFSSPRCGHCRIEMPMIVKLSMLAKKNAGVELIIASYEDAIETKQWLETIRAEDNVDVKLPVIVAPRGRSDFQQDYNPKGLLPSFCLIDEDGIVRAQGPIPSIEWRKIKRTWEGVTSLSSVIFNQQQ
jgi:alkyl hydroperoxide reductase subunit AhpC